jgi:hypothetical protein
MKATIEIGKKPQVFWLAALEMCEEHMGYYARENAFRANFRTMQAWVDSVNSGLNPKYATLQLLGLGGDWAGSLPPTQQVWGQFDPIYTDGDPGFSFQVDPDKDDSLYAAWNTSGGNVLSLRLQGPWVWATADGRRHGIPWRFLNNCGLVESDLLVIGQESESTAKPWQDGKGNSLWTPEGRARSFNGYLTELAKPLEDYPSWGNYHQQAGWAANRVYAWSKLGGLLRACASVGAESGAIYERREEKWPNRIVPTIRWGELTKKYKGSLNPTLNLP